MGKVQSPLLGYNTNVQYKGKVFHIQTEDSGVNKPHVMTHLFADGGRIIKSQKTSYAQSVGDEDLPTLVKKLMQEQHKAMIVALRDGNFDAQLAFEKRTESQGETVPDAGPMIEAAREESAVVEAVALQSESVKVEVTAVVSGQQEDLRATARDTQTRRWTGAAIRAVTSDAERTLDELILELLAQELGTN